MIESAVGLILRTRPLTETSLIVHWLTPAFGRIATVAKGARRPKSQFLGKLDLFYVADFSFSRSRRSELHVLREVGLRELHAVLRQNLVTLRQAIYAVSLVEQVTETETPLPGVYDLMLGLLKCLSESSSARPQIVFALELRLLRELGLQPDWNNTRLSGGAKKISQTLMEDGWAAAARLRLSKVQTAELREFIHGFLIFHLGRVPKGRITALAEGV